ncbi:MAG: hypothetical protein HQ505_08060 [Nitrosopumilus sp.]|nr:hypothetical protein [Nitrosopumilus sp.]
MVVPIIILVAIPIFLGLVYMPPFDMPVEEEPKVISAEIEPKVISEEPEVSILYYILMGIWSLYLIKILLQVKKGTFKVTQKY